MLSFLEPTNILNVYSAKNGKKNRREKAFFGGRGSSPTVLQSSTLFIPITLKSKGEPWNSFIKAAEPKYMPVPKTTTSPPPLAIIIISFNKTCKSYKMSTRYKAKS